MSDYLFDFFLACILLGCFVVWLLNRKTVKWLIRQWILARQGWVFVKRNRHHAPWAALPFLFWWVVGDMPAWVLLVRLITVSSLVAFYKLWRKRQKAAMPKQRGIVYIPPQHKRDDDEVRRRQTDQAGNEATSECESPSTRPGGQTSQEIMETPGVDEQRGPKPIFSAGRVRRIRQDESGKTVD